MQGLPWAYTQEQLTPMFEQLGKIAHSEVIYGRDGRSRVRQLLSLHQCTDIPQIALVCSAL